MARQTGNFTQAIRYLYSRWYDPSSAQQQHDMNNNTPITFASADDTTSIHAISADVDNVIRVDKGCMLGARLPITFQFPAAGTLSTQRVFIADRPLVITAIEEIHSTAETASGTATLVVTKDSGVITPGSGVNTMTNTFNLKGTANTVQTATLLGVDGLGNPNAGIVLAAGDTLSIVVGGTATITALAGVTVTIWAAPGFKEIPAVFQAKANSAIATQSFYVASRDEQVTGVQMIWSTAGTDAGTVTLDVTHDASGTAAGGGNSILAAAQSAKTAANTVVNVALTATASRLLLIAGDRISLKTTGTLTALAGLVIVVYTRSRTSGYIGQVDVTQTVASSIATQGVFLADRDYEVVDFWVNWGTAGSGTVDCTIDKGVVAPGAGASCLSGTQAVTGTAATPVSKSVSTTRSARLMSVGDLLSVKQGGTLGALAQLSVTVSLLPR